MRKRINKFCRLYKYICGACGKERHKRHFVRPGEICPSCVKKNPVDENQISLFTNQDQDNGKIESAVQSGQAA